MSKTDEDKLGFYVPRHVKDFYGLKPGLYKGGVSMVHGELTSSPIRLTKYRKTLRGSLRKHIGELGVIAEVWIYRDTWTAPKEKVKST